MILKQFFQLAGGILAAIIIYRFPLIGLLKWPLMGLSVLVGVLLAFVPINGRPFSQWVMAFIRAIYSPTEFHWNPSPQPSAPSPQSLSAPRRGPLDVIESQLFSKFSALFQQIHPSPPSQPPASKPAPSRPLSPFSFLSQSIIRYSHRLAGQKPRGSYSRNFRCHRSPRPRPALQ